MIPIKTPAEIEAMRPAGRIVGEVLKRLPERIRPGVTTAELDAWAEGVIVGYGARPAFKGYHGFPAALCTSVNEQVVHGFPGPRTLRTGDIISVDVGVKLNGWMGDGAWTFAVGKVSPAAERLLQVTRESLERGIAAAQVGRTVSDIGHAVQKYVEAAGFSVVRDYVGHGIGRELHEEPQVPNYGPAHQGALLREGMVLAIEPMVNAGDFAVKTLEDQWTVVTRDRSLSAHFEHTVALVNGKAEILTL